MTSKSNTNTEHHLDPLADHVFDLLRQGEPHLRFNEDVIEFCQSLADSIGVQPVKFNTGIAKRNSEGNIELYPNGCDQYWIARPDED